MAVFHADTQTVATDVLVLGGGIAGHRAALAAAQSGVAVTLAYLARGASPFVIGCNMPIGHADTRDGPEIYCSDMIKGGYGLNDRRLVRAMASGAVTAFGELRALGVPFAREGERILQRHLSGNTYPRSVYVPEGIGRSIIDCLAGEIRTRGVKSLPGWKAIAILRDDADVVGALLWSRRDHRLCAVHARAVVIAVGGIGRLYHDSTYPADVEASAYGLALDVGARLIDMEFVQFEPVVTVWPNECRGMEMPTAMLGDGAHLLNAAGERFMFRHNPEHGEKCIEKARMALCIQKEIDEGRGLPDGSVVFDTRAVPEDRLETYVSHCRRLRAAGLEPTSDAPHVRPAAHSQMGGIYIDESGWSGVPGLYAGGEAAGGVHGASRIAGNGSSDAIVFGDIAGRGAAAGMLGPAKRDRAQIVGRAMELMPLLTGQRNGSGTPAEAKNAIRDVVSRSAGIWRDHTQLTVAQHALQRIERDIEGLLTLPNLDSVIEAIETRHMAVTAITIVEAALLRTESRGAHQRIDFPHQDNANWLRHIGFRRNRDRKVVSDTIAIQ